MFEIFQPIFQVSNDFIISLVAICLIALFVLGFNGKIPKPVASGLMVSLGIFGTFWGILIALHPLDFAPEKMNDSVKALLDGMKTAFVTSFLGLLFAIVSKFIWEMHNAKLGNKSVNPVHKDMNERLDAIRHAIAGDDDSSMVSQLKILRADNQEGFKKLDGLSETIRDTLVNNLKNMMENLANELREILANQLRGQIETLIKNIEKALIKQFGETFVQFNQAVQALKKWQEEHREQVEQLTVAFDDSAKGIAQIKNDCNAIPPTMEKLKLAVEMANAQMQQLEERLGAFANMKKQAEESFPIIKENLDSIGKDLQASASGFHQMEKIINDSVNSIAETMRSRIEEMQNGVSNAIKMAVNESTSAVNQETETMTGNMHKAQVQINAVIKETVEKSLQEFDRQMKSEVDTMTQKWGQNMIAIASEYADVITRIKD